MNLKKSLVVKLINSLSLNRVWGHWVEKEKIFFVFKYKSNTFDRIKIIYITKEYNILSSKHKNKWEG